MNWILPKGKSINPNNKVFASEKLNFKLNKIYEWYQNWKVPEEIYKFVLSVWQFYEKNKFITYKQYEKINKIFFISQNK